MLSILLRLFLTFISLFLCLYLFYIFTNLYDSKQVNMKHETQGQIQVVMPEDKQHSV